MDELGLRERLGGLLLDSAPCLVAVLDRQYRIVLCNSAFQSSFGQRQGDRCYEAYKGRDRPCDGCFASLTFGDGQERVCERQEGLTAGQRTIIYGARAVALRADDGGIPHVAIISVDQTRLIELEEGLRQAERLAEVGMTTAGLAHTIKNILAGLDGGIYMVDSGLEKSDGERTRSGWEMVRKYVEQVGGIVRNLLSYARRGAPVREPCAPADLVHDVVALHAAKAQSQGVALVAYAAGDLPQLEMDREAMHAALNNLVTNALDACVWDPDVGKSHEVTVSAKPSEGGGVAFVVRDTGMGMSKEYQAKALSVCFTTKGIRGTGLGLLLCKKTAQEHGGSIDFVSTPGQGTEFKIELPPPGSPEEPVSSGAGNEQESPSG